LDQLNDVSFHYFIWQLSIVIHGRLAYRIDETTLLIAHTRATASDKRQLSAKMRTMFKTALTLGLPYLEHFISFQDACVNWRDVKQ
jgi:hypothetical protein